MKLKKIISAVLAVYSVLVVVSAHAQEDWRPAFIKSLGNGSVFVEDQNGNPLFSHRIDESFIPASTLKVATTATALDVLGRNFRFVTEFYMTNEGNLYVKGFGDPLITSEEMHDMADHLSRKGIHSIKNIVLDTSFFSSHIIVDGAEKSSNPYDAVNSALLVNFNTLFLKKTRNGVIQSAEPQTPLTPTMMQMGRKLPVGIHRVNLTGDPKIYLRYFGELLQAFLQEEHVTILGDIKEGITPAAATMVYQHRSSQDLEEVIKGMLKHSTNLTANQIFLTTGATVMGPPATMEKGAAAASQFLKQKVGWDHFNIVEGSGLSRKNQVTARQMMKLLRYFEPDMDLLPLKDDVFMAKTGTLNGVNTYFGYFPLGGHNWARFVILVNDNVGFAHKFVMAKKLYRALNGLPPEPERKRVVKKSAGIKKKKRR